ncbi:MULTISPECIES: methyltransferase [Kitasatospora]|uniref:Putative methyltransferase n=1 Tax=Kitasatospora setae (strain ATCC 33774 / DSM 43861 / JCM 3304 / KCC A-0304 / NBRC 14216 / KM-6054) TaxID=452652 RepID=E4N5V0_KITSK|nr:MULTISPECIES: methyltransferase [Kitasatospora]BAJ26581.1 putative methyltransferase [Kitasatospora setae KM-6054]
MLLLRPPGVYPAQGDTALLLDVLSREPLRPGARCLDIGTGCGALALAAARRGCRVTAVDLSRLSLATAWLNARLHRLPLRVRHADLLPARPRDGPGPGGGYDLVLSNPPYVPAPSPGPPPGAARAWDAGSDGRLLLDRLCRRVPPLLAPGGTLLLVQSSLAQPALTVGRLRAAGLRTTVAARRLQGFGPVMTARAPWFERTGLIEPGVRTEELVVIRGVRP